MNGWWRRRSAMLRAHHVAGASCTANNAFRRQAQAQGRERANQGLTLHAIQAPQRRGENPLVQCCPVYCPVRTVTQHLHGLKAKDTVNAAGVGVLAQKQHNTTQHNTQMARTRSVWLR